jgi:hypothetical protein
MAIPSEFKWMIAGLLAVLCVSGCGESSPPVGMVAVKAAPGFTVPPLALNADDKWFSDPERFTLKESGNPTVLRREPGRYTLQVDRDGRLLPACKFER